MNDSGARFRTRPVLRARGALLLACGALLVAGCTRTVVRDAPVPVVPMLSVERFLQASNARDFAAMARLFGTADGPLADTGGTFGCAFRRIGSWIGMGDRCRRPEEVELQMASISAILSHRDYRVASERQEPGRTEPTTRLGVDITRDDGSVVRDVPFLVVRTAAGDWLIQEIDLLRVTAGP